MNKTLDQLIKISNITGKDATLTQGGGGNTSVKTDDGKSMYIKASGTALKDMDEKQGWRRLKIDEVLGILSDKTIASLDMSRREIEIVNRLMLCCDDDTKSSARPSVEAHLHALLDKVVIHLHPNAVGAYVNCKKGQKLVDELFKDQKLPALWVGYADPGFMLATKIKSLVADYKKQYNAMPAILFLEKHGLFVTASSDSKAVELVRDVIARCNSKLKQVKAGKLKRVAAEEINSCKLAVRKAFFNATGQYTSVSYFYDDEIASFMKEKHPTRILSSQAIAPDELVYANGPAMWFEKCSAEKIEAKLKKQIGSGNKPATTFLIKDVGLFVAGKKSSAGVIRDIVASSLFTRTNAAKLGGLITLNKRQQEFINQWESEAFRKKMAVGAGQGQLVDRIAVVTGAGSGLGKAIAVGLARAGACVVLADIDAASAENTANEIRTELPLSQSLVLGCNVTDEKSVKDGFGKILDEFGGLDILVNAAGVAPAGPMTEISVEKWRFALEVNLTGYFLMAQNAAKIMIAQGMAGSIINLTSKSGLEASKNNTPYNATKAGEIHMARGWALELGQYGIRVNCVAAGNVFEGSKIWNPQYIKECAQKYNIKPEEVIPYYVGKTALNKEIKGQDIADSIIFLCSDSARRITGQTLVADAGQVMVR